MTTHTMDTTQPLLEHVENVDGLLAENWLQQQHKEMAQDAARRGRRSRLLTALGVIVVGAGSAYMFAGPALALLQ